MSIIGSSKPPCFATYNVGEVDHNSITYFEISQFANLIILLLRFLCPLSLLDVFTSHCPRIRHVSCKISDVASLLCLQCCETVKLVFMTYWSLTHPYCRLSTRDTYQNDQQFILINIVKDRERVLQASLRQSTWRAFSRCS